VKSVRKVKLAELKEIIINGIITVIYGKGTAEF
jgi:hypothetical protein